MGIIVAKFGGSSTANADCFKRILTIIRESEGRRYIVLSAPGTDENHTVKVTELLEKCWLRKAHGLPVAGLIGKICRRFGEISDGLGLPRMDRLIRSEVNGGLRDSLARTLSRGEYLCARLFSEWSGSPMMDAKALISFDGDGQIDAPRTLGRIARATKAHPRLVIPGFYGEGPDGSVVTFPRNGSDITGALVAAGANSALYENWTDVSGLMTADPAVVPDARLIRQISYTQMRRLARAGAQVLHPACLDPVAMAGIPTRLRCANTPECFGTLIDDRCIDIVPCIAGLRKCGAEELPAGMPRGAGGVALLTAFGLTGVKESVAEKALNPIHISHDACSTRFYVRADRYASAMRALHKLLMA